MYNWKFKPYTRDDVKEDPIQDEFFTTSDVGSLSNAVVREGIQNALDEKNGNLSEIVKVRIFLSGDKYAIEPSAYLPYLNELKPHLESKTSGISSMPDFKSRMKFLVFEDFNTGGLEGNPEEFQDTETGDKTKSHNFYYFWRNIGRSGKADEKLGRWGLGKTVFPASSRINTFWGITVRKSDGRKLLMGQSILRGHNLAENPLECGYRPYGFFGRFDNADSYFSKPVEDETVLSAMESLFRLERKNLSGLSIIVPFCSLELTFDRLVYSVIEQYFFPLLSGKLEVEVCFEDKSTVLSQANIRNVPGALDFEQLRSDENLRIMEKQNLLALFDFANWTIKLDENLLTKLVAPAVTNVPGWRETLFKGIDFDVLINRFEKEKRIGFLVPVKVHPLAENPVMTWYKVLLEKDDTLERSEYHFIRNGITIAGIKTAEYRGLRAIVLIEDAKLVRMLGDSENPAHTEWQRDSRNFKDRYTHGPKCLSFVISSISKLYGRLQKPVEGLDTEILKDIFYFDAGDNVTRVATNDDDSEKDENKPGFPPDVKASKQLVRIKRTEGGFIISGPADLAEIEEPITVRMGYIVPKGNPIKKYQVLDFDLSKPPITIKPKGVNILASEKNTLEFEITDEYCEITVTGFDRKRDLLIKVID